MMMHFLLGPSLRWRLDERISKFESSMTFEELEKAQSSIADMH